MEARRRSDGHNEPQMQVVGFHVEGQSPSPSPASLLQDSLRTISTGSPTPVIIPPQFQVRQQMPSNSAVHGFPSSIEPVTVILSNAERAWIYTSGRSVCAPKPGEPAVKRMLQQLQFCCAFSDRLALCCAGSGTSCKHTTRVSSGEGIL